MVCGFGFFFFPFLCVESNLVHMNCDSIYSMAEINLHFTELYKMCFFIPGVLQNSLCWHFFLITVLFCSCARCKNCLHEGKQIDSQIFFCEDFLAKEG